MTWPNKEYKTCTLQTIESKVFLIDSMGSSVGSVVLTYFCTCLPEQ